MWWAIVKVGLLGPSNLLRKILSVVQDMDDASFVPLEYVLPQEAPRLVSDNQNDLDAIFFCGSIPYCLCLDSVPRTIHGPTFRCGRPGSSSRWSTPGSTSADRSG